MQHRALAGVLAFSSLVASTGLAQEDARLARARRALGDAKPEVRIGALEQLGDLDGALPLLLEVLIGDTHHEVRRAACKVVAEIGAPAVGRLTEALTGADPVGRQLIVVTLGRIGPGAVAARPALAALLSDEDRQVALGAAEALLEIGLDEPSRASLQAAVPAIVADLTDDILIVRVQAAAVLGGLTPPAPEAVAALVARVGEDSRFEVVEQAAQSLARLGVGLQPIVNRMHEFNLLGFASEVEILGEALGKAGPPALPLLRGLLTGRKSAELVAAALRGLTVVGPDAVPDLQAALADDQAWIRRQAALGLADLGSDAAPAAPALERLSDDPDQGVRDAARDALAAIRGE